MKKLLIIALFILINVSQSYSYVLEEFTANDGLSFLKANNSELNNKKLLFIQSYEMKGYADTKLDFLTGKAFSWTFIFKSNDTTDKSGYMYIMDKPDGVFDVNFQTDNQTDYQKLAELPEQYINSDSICKQIVQSSDWMNYYENKKEQIIRKSLSLTYDDIRSNFVWTALLYVSAADMALCYFDALKGEPIDCEISPTSVKEYHSLNFTFNPNPVNERLLISYYAEADIDITIINNLGMKVIEKNFRQTEGFSQVEIDLSELTSGLYYCTVKFGDCLETRKIVLVR